MAALYALLPHPHRGSAEHIKVREHDAEKQLHCRVISGMYPRNVVKLVPRV